MSYGLTEEQNLIQQSAKEFAAEYVEPNAAEIDHSAKQPTDIVTKLAEYDYLGLYLPEEYGGSEAGFVSFVLIVEELAKASGSVASILINHSAKAAYALSQWGTEQQKKTYLNALVKGEKLGAFAVNEVGAACGIGPNKVVATKQNDSYVLSGRKAYVANGGAADVYIILAMTDPEAGNKGLSAFIVEANTPGLSVGQAHKKMGLRGCQSAELALDQVTIPAENRLGDEGLGAKIIDQTLAVASIAEGAQVVGIAQAALDDTIRYSKERIQFGKPINAFPAIQNMLAEMAANIHLLRLGVYHAAQLIENGEPFNSEAGIVKLTAARIGQSALIDVIQIQGGYGYSEEMIASRFFRDIKGCALKDGSAEFPEQKIVAELLA